MDEVICPIPMIDALWSSEQVSSLMVPAISQHSMVSTHEPVSRAETTAPYIFLRWADAWRPYDQTFSLNII